MQTLCRTYTKDFAFSSDLLNLIHDLEVELLIEGEGSKAHISIPKSNTQQENKLREQVKKLKGKKRHYKKEFVKAKGEAQAMQKMLEVMDGNMRQVQRLNDALKLKLKEKDRMMDELLNQ